MIKLTVVAECLTLLEMRPYGLRLDLRPLLTLAQEESTQKAAITGSVANSLCLNSLLIGTLCLLMRAHALIFLSKRTFVCIKDKLKFF